MALRQGLAGSLVPGQVSKVISGAVAVVAVCALAACGAAPTTHTTHTPTPGTTATATASASAQLSWTVVTNVPAITTDLVFAPSNSQIVYLCADDGPAAAPLPTTPRLHKSSNGGQTWSLLTAAPPLHPVSDGGIRPLTRCDVFVDAADANDVFLQQIELDPQGAGTAILHTLYRSRDGGTNWTELRTIDRTDGFTALYVASGRVIGLYRPSFYGGAGGCSTLTTPLQTNTLVASDDGGATWHDTATTIESHGYGHNVLAQAGNVIFTAGAQATSTSCVAATNSAIWRSADGGRTWTQVTTLPLAYNDNLSFTPTSTASGYDGAIRAAGDPGSVGVPYYTRNSGSTWTPLPPAPTSNEGIPTEGAIGLIALPDGDVLGSSGTNGPVIRLRPSDAHPIWREVAPGSGGAWQVINAHGVTTLWSLAFQYENSSIVEYLMLPS